MLSSGLILVSRWECPVPEQDAPESNRTRSGIRNELRRAYGLVAQNVFSEGGGGMSGVLEVGPLCSGGRLDVDELAEVSGENEMDRFLELYRVVSTEGRGCQGVVPDCQVVSRERNSAKWRASRLALPATGEYVNAEGRPKAISCRGIALGYSSFQWAREIFGGFRAYLSPSLQDTW